ncbi:hypothetical protein [Erwinia phage Snitter]|nr:hypothetical protein [Erwinia phage Snitter]
MQDLNKITKESRQYEHDCVASLCNAGVISMASPAKWEEFIEEALIQPGTIQSVMLTDNENINALLQVRQALRCPDGDNIVEHAKAIRAMADALIKVSEQ